MPSPRLAVDIVIQYPDGRIVLVNRGVEPFKGLWAIPGGGVEAGETVEQAAVRETKEETGLDVELRDIVGVYSDPERDPRGPTVSVVYRAVPTGGEMKADTDAADVTVTDDVFGFPLAFDHEKILRDALAGKRGEGHS